MKLKLKYISYINCKFIVYFYFLGLIQTMTSKKFVGIKFTSGQWQVVPLIWLVDNNTKCFWPSSGDVKTLARNCTPPNVKNWSCWIIKEICVASGEYLLIVMSYLLVTLGAN